MKNKVSASVSYDDGLLEDLKDPEFAVTYLNAILTDHDKHVKERFLTALSFVARAHGISKLAVETKLQRESLRKALSEKGNPTISTLFSLLKAFGLRFRLETEDKPRESTSNRTHAPGTTLVEVNEKLSEIQKTVEHLAKKQVENTEAVTNSTGSATKEHKLSVEGARFLQFTTVNAQGGTKNVH